MAELWPELLTQQLFEGLFEGNCQRYGTEEGGSVVAEYDMEEIMEWHLTGFMPPIGIYPIDPDTNMCKWGCIDFDEGEELSLLYATNVTRCLEVFNIKAWVERSRSKGYHVWVFCKEWVEPIVMRNALLYVCDFMGAPAKEVNPKQASLQGEQVGNYVRLPYPKHLGCVAHDHRRVVVNVDEDSFVYGLGHFVRAAWENRTPTDVLKQLASNYKRSEPIEQKAYTCSEDVSVDDELLSRLTRSARRMYDHGPKISDRSRALVALAGMMARDRTHDEDEARAVLAAADANWGKYAPRADGDQRLDEIIERAFNDRDGSVL